MSQKNRQIPTKQHLSVYGDLTVHSVFPTIQGEGPHAGKRAIFIRLAHCNLQCPGCDTEYTEGATEMTVEKILGKVLYHGAGHNLVVITGGEPFRQNIRPLVDDLIRYDYKVQLETNGVLYVPMPPKVDIIVSPKTHFVHEDLQHRATAYKYVLQSGDIGEDGLPIHALGHKVKDHVFRPPLGYKGTVYVQPMDEHDTFRNAENINATVNSVLTHDYTLCLQMHKYIGVE